MTGFHADGSANGIALEGILRQNTKVYEVLRKAERLGLPSYAIGAGCVAQSVWNFSAT